MTFHPQINQKSVKILKNKGLYHDGDHEVISKNLHDKKIKQLKEKYQTVAKNEIESYFTPKINSQSRKMKARGIQALVEDVSKRRVKVKNDKD